MTAIAAFAPPRGRRRSAAWGGVPADLLPPGWLFRDPVELSLPGIDAEPFDPARFSFDPRYFPQGAPQTPGMGFAGLRLRYPLNHADRHDDLLVLQGASYFRALAHGTAYGLSSARRLALGTGGTGARGISRHPPHRCPSAPKRARCIWAA
jgi:periplasmic glucans biosynthesis protein